MKQAGEMGARATGAARAAGRVRAAGRMRTAGTRLAAMLLTAVLCCAGAPTWAWAEDTIDGAANGLVAVETGAAAAAAAAEAAQAVAQADASAEGGEASNEGEGENGSNEGEQPQTEGENTPEAPAPEPEEEQAPEAAQEEATSAPVYVTETAAGAGDYASGAGNPAASASDSSPAVAAPSDSPSGRAPSSTTSVDVNEQNLVDPTQRADNSFIYDTSIGAISGQSRLYDNRTVQVEGEVIGDRIAAGNGYYWVELASRDEVDTATISVLVSEDMTTQIDHYGRYGVTGTTLQVRGTYHEACDEHEGLSDIHATNASTLLPGEENPDEFDLQAFIPGLVTVAIGGILLLVFRFARERMR